MLNVNGQVYVTNMKEISPRLVVGDVYCHEKLNDNDYNTTFVKAKFVGDALITLYGKGIKNKDKIYLDKSVLKSSSYTNKEGKEITRLELTVFSISIIDNNNTTQSKGKFDR